MTTPKGTLLSQLPLASLVRPGHAGHSEVLWVEDAIVHDDAVSMLKIYRLAQSQNTKIAFNLFHMLIASMSSDSNRCVNAILRKEPFIEHCIDAVAFSVTSGLQSVDTHLSEWRMVAGLRDALVDLSEADASEFRRVFDELMRGEFSDFLRGRQIVLEVMNHLGDDFYAEYVDKLDHRYSNTEIVADKLIRSMDSEGVWDYSNLNLRLQRVNKSLDFFEDHGTRVSSQVQSLRLLRELTTPMPRWAEEHMTPELAKQRVDTLARLEKVGVDFSVVDLNGHGLADAAIENCDGEVILFCAQRGISWLSNYKSASLSRRATLNKSRSAAAAVYLHLLKICGHEDLYNSELSALAVAGQKKGGLLKGQGEMGQEQVRLLLERRYPPLASAAFSLSSSVMRSLVAMGASLEERAQLDGEKGEQSVMECAVLSKRLENIKYAISLGFDVHEVGSTGRPVISRTNNASILQVLRSEEASRGLMDAFADLGEGVAVPSRKSGLSML